MIAVWVASSTGRAFDWLARPLSAYAGMGALPSPYWIEGFGVRVPGDPFCRGRAFDRRGRLNLACLPFCRGATASRTGGYVFEKLIIQRTLRVPASTGAAGDGTPVARQLDAALLDVGFSASRTLLEHVGALAAGPAMDLAATVVSAVRELVGDHVQHNAYFIGFPDGVPDTVEFWVERLRAAVLTGGGKATDAQLRDAVVLGGISLLDLPGYGVYQHTYPELLAAHDALIAAAGDRVTLLHLGDAADVEASRLYRALAGSATPHGEADLALLSELAIACVDGEQPAEIPVRENRAVLNGVRLVLGRPLVAVDTTTDVLRLACQVSGGDVSLAAPTRFRAFPRRERRDPARRARRDRRCESGQTR